VLLNSFAVPADAEVKTPENRLKQKLHLPNPNVRHLKVPKPRNVPELKLSQKLNVA
jgi:hypothetical protein